MLLRCLLLILLCVGTPREAQGQGGACARSHDDWSRRCSERTGVPLQVLHCPPGRVVVRAGSGTTAVLVEVSSASEHSFQSAGTLGASPVGEFPDWNQEPRERQEAFAAVVSCLDDLSLLRESRAPLRPPQAPRRPPWLLLAAVSMLGFLSLIPRRSRPRASLHNTWLGLGLEGALALLILALLTLIGRRLLIPARFFHQNGQGPLWVEAAAYGDLSFSYGPGYPELFGWLAGAFPGASERAIFEATALLGALVPPAGVLLALSSGTTAGGAWVVGGCLALHPLLGRLSRGESYLGVQIALLTVAAAALARAGRIRGRPWLLAGAVVGAGLLVAQAARVHPTSWLAGATVPLVLLAQPGSVTGRGKRTVLAGAGVGGMVLLTSGQALWGVYQGPLGQQWRPSSLVSLTFPWLGLVLCGGLAWRLRRHPGLLLALAAGGAALGVLQSADMLRLNFPWIADAYRLQFLPVLLASGAATLATIRKRRFWAPATLATVGVAAVVFRWPEYTTVPTDVREQAWAQGWRETIPPGSSITYLSRAGERIVMLPLDRERWHVQALTTGQETTVPRLPTGGYYYRSSLCSTPEGRPVCEALEQGGSLEAVVEQVLPGIASLPWLPLPRDPIRVGLYRVR
ncbi:MAG: hypothetical protein RMJ98_07455 [Myxococcales bacterium]|nr:hypothetical protein [Polyangiaceae bacterium]MDW8249121.1 hypothetical protein [Myxococcales bacterium]